jgi:hypothetical protein
MTSGSRYLSFPIPPKTAIFELNITDECAHLGILCPSVYISYHIFKCG